MRRSQLSKSLGEEPSSRENSKCKDSRTVQGATRGPVCLEQNKWRGERWGRDELGGRRADHTMT